MKRKIVGSSAAAARSPSRWRSARGSTRRAGPQRLARSKRSMSSARRSERGYGCGSPRAEPQEPAPAGNLVRCGLGGRVGAAWKRAMLGREACELTQRRKPRERLALELADALARQVELVADRFERPRLALEAESQLEDPSLPLGQRVERLADVLAAIRQIGPTLVALPIISEILQARRPWRLAAWEYLSKSPNVGYIMPMERTALDALLKVTSGTPILG